MKAITIGVLLIALAIIPRGLPAATLYCGQDLDNDGKATGPGETAQCIDAGSSLCPIGLTKCRGAQSDPVCPASTVLNGTLDKCEGDPSGTPCTAPYTYDDGNDLCLNPVACPDESTFLPASDLCDKSYDLGCTSPFTRSIPRDRCEKDPTCSEGSYSASRDRCEVVTTPSCPAGFSYDNARNTCTEAPVCSSGSEYSPAAKSCVKAAHSSSSYSCPYGDGSNRPCETGWWRDLSVNVSTWTTACGNYPDGTIISCNLNTYYRCDAGFGLSGTTCYQTPACSPGSLNGATDMCETAPTRGCSAGFSYDGGNGVCFRSAGCASGALDSDNDVCYQALVQSCPSGFTYNSGTGRCERQASTLCTARDAYSALLDSCTRPPSWQCTAGAVYVPSAKKCQATPSCTNSMYYPDLNKCFDDSYKKCPFNAATPCVDISGELQCSPNQCFDPKGSGAGQEVVVENDSSMLTNDGARDSAGNCLDQIYIFTGRSMTCQTSGVDSGWTNCCMTSEAPLKDNVGSTTTVMGAMSTIKHVYHLAQIAYYGNLILNGTGGVDISGLSAAVFDAVNAANKAGSVMAGFQSYAAATFLNPASIAFSVALYLAQEILLSGSCSQEDLETAMMDSSGRCHYINSYCKKKWPLIGCVQEVDVFCCFNSKLARIIHEQGRPQLKTFTPLWGFDEGPGNCRGFTASEFQMLDFSKMNLSEYFGEITTKAQSQIQGQVGTKVNEYFNKTQE